MTTSSQPTRAHILDWKREAHSFKDLWHVALSLALSLFMYIYICSLSINMYMYNMYMSESMRVYIYIYIIYVFLIYVQGIHILQYIHIQVYIHIYIYIYVWCMYIHICIHLVFCLLRHGFLCLVAVLVHRCVFAVHHVLAVIAACLLQRYFMLFVREISRSFPSLVQRRRNLSGSCRH